MAFTNHKRQIFIIEAGDTWIKWALAQPDKNLMAMVDVGVIPVETKDNAGANESLVNLIKKYKVQSDEVICCIPRYQVTARNIELPSTHPD